jgi:SAM-dependent methyltransferase
MDASDTTLYREVWERYWSSIPAAPQTAFWDSTPEHAAALDLPRFAHVFGRERTLIDFGCGNGTQTRFLARKFPKVIGVDVSAAAIDAARSVTLGDSPRFELLDGTDGDSVAAFVDRIGDANVYMRTVLHQARPEHRPGLVATLRRLMGATGVLYLVELSDEADGYFRKLAQDAGGRPPPGLLQVLQSGITPGLLSVADIAALFPDCEIEHGPTVVTTVHVLPDGQPARVPAFYALIRPAPQS